MRVNKIVYSHLVPKLYNVVELSGGNTRARHRSLFLRTLELSSPKRRAGFGIRELHLGINEVDLEVGFLNRLVGVCAARDTPRAFRLRLETLTSTSQYSPDFDDFDRSTEVLISEGGRKLVLMLGQ